MKRLKNFRVSLAFLCFLLAIAVLFFVLPQRAYSENEKRVLADFPEVNWESVADGSFGKGLETYLADHFPLRDAFVGIHSYMEQLLGQNGVSGIYRGSDGYLFAAPGAFDAARARRNVENLAEFAQSTGLPSAVMVVPSAGYVLEEKLPVNHQSYWDDTLMEITEDAVGNMAFIDLRQDFLQQPEGLYYRTDHHLTGLGSYRMYQAFCLQQGITPLTFSCTERYEGFYGTSYAKSGLWGTEPDALEIWKPENPGSYQVTIQEGEEIETFQSLYFPEHLEKQDKYPVFLDGNHSLVTVKNENCQNGKRLMLIKDSYAHCFATYAIEHYEEIVLVDMRYYRDSVQEIIQSRGITEILFLYGAQNLASSTDIAWLLPAA